MTMLPDTSNADDLLRRQGVMETARANFEGLWQEVAQLLLPRQAEFLGSDFAATQGLRRTERIFDETAMLSLDHGVAVFEGEVIPQGGLWQRLMARDEALLRNQRVRLWFEQLTDRLFALRNSPYSGFANQTHESVASLLAFGVQGMWVDSLRQPGTGRAVGLSYRSEHIGQIFIQENYRGEVDIVHRRFHLTHRQALQKWPDNPPACAAKAQRDGKRLDDTACYIHVLQPNPRHDPDRIDARAMRIHSAYLSVSDRQVFDEGGYRRMPLIVSRYEKSPTEQYGRSPAINVLPAVKACQAMQRDLVTAIEFMARPALGVSSDMQDEMLFYAPGGISYGAIDERGQRMIQRLWDDPDLSMALRLQETTRAIIQRAFFEDLYTIRQEVKSHVSATEIMQREQEKGILLAPLKRQEHEWFTPMADRELDLMAEMGMLDDMPPELIEAGGLFETVYENPLARARKAEQAGGFYQLLQGFAPIMQADQSGGALKALLTKYPPERVLDGLGKIHGVPASWEASEDEIAAAQAADAEAAQTAQILELGDRASVIARNLGGAMPAEAQNVA
ncbi:portal protein [Sphingomonas flavalba]|uniref:portal protein n=1 Tax=Sphingomonas flavalba TaxID=2559804 RepID=UPI0039E17996